MVFEMPLFGQSQFNKLVDKITQENNTSEDWQSILECCDLINSQQTKQLDNLRYIIKRMHHQIPNVSIQAIILLDACISNCGKKFHLEVASREFIAEARKFLETGHKKVVLKFKLMLKKWAENEFKSDPELNFIPSFYQQLKKEGYDFTDPSKPNLPKDPNIVMSDQEEEDIIKALELSMKDIKSPTRTSASGSRQSATSTPVAATTATTTSLYPEIQANFNDFSSRTANTNVSATTNIPSNNQKESFKVRALYDFEAAEENELTFKAGEVIVVTDDRDENWWSGNNHRGDGLFPANFVTKDLDAPLEAANGKSVQFDDQVRVKFLEEEVTEVDENKIDRLLQLIHEADPTGVTPDSDELLMLEDQCGKMGKLVDKELERLDRIQVSLNMANRQLTEAMREYLYLNH